MNLTNPAADGFSSVQYDTTIETDLHTTWSSELSTSGESADAACNEPLTWPYAIIPCVVIFFSGLFIILTLRFFYKMVKKGGKSFFVPAHSKLFLFPFRLSRRSLTYSHFSAIPEDAILFAPVSCTFISVKVYRFRKISE
ncbi:hypothetical protein HELRODRAFT_170322 [Helobdella robusta]|uniref:Uncharacterized protein n=1 Tax=Helobdella robusta TaxID=6412 RepID=T1F2X3_HELRO|nr:hypothetical protein HELRODRAFT_170322 [Helobdella robusta]ESO07770.1 hypothetical protein HELRODRAFT_170322 [Helobdella robusta]